MSPSSPNTMTRAERSTHSSTRGKVRIDTHFHANITYLPPSSREKKARTIVPALSHLDVLCSTEHIYKDPLLAYDFLCYAKEKYLGDFEVIPGIENISKEGVELIFLASNRDHLTEILRKLPAFKWSIFDTELIRSASAITIVPHPFSPSKTGIVTTIGEKRALELMEDHHYIEVCNGAFLNRIYKYIPHKKLNRSIYRTAKFPDHLLHDKMRGSIGSDAHQATDISCYGEIDNFDFLCSTFENLAKRPKMDARYMKGGNSSLHALSSLAITGLEAAHKKVFKKRI